METMNKENFSKSLKQGLQYPWAKPSRLWNILWMLLPIFGWFALGGYGKKIARSLVHGNTKELPEFGPFWNNFKEGLFIFVFLIPTWIVLFAFLAVPYVGRFVYHFAALFLLQWLVLNFYTYETFDSLWNVKKAFKTVTNNFVEYLFAFLKTIVFFAVYLVLCLVLVGIPCLMFGGRYFIAEFYRKHN